MASYPQCTYVLKMPVAVFAEMENLQLERRSYTLNSSLEKRWTRVNILFRSSVTEVYWRNLILASCYSSMNQSAMAFLLEFHFALYAYSEERVNERCMESTLCRTCLLSRSPLAFLGVEKLARPRRRKRAISMSGEALGKASCAHDIPASVI
jgi:hypothetical protein